MNAIETRMVGDRGSFIITRAEIVAAPTGALWMAERGLNAEARLRGLRVRAHRLQGGAEDGGVLFEWIPQMERWPGEELPRSVPGW